MFDAAWKRDLQRGAAPGVPASALQGLAGRFITIDGPDGAGKTTQLSVLTQRLREAGLRVVTTRDPGGTAVGDGIRELLLHLPEHLGRPTPYCELLLFMASRAQLVAEVIRPALARGETVITDRFIWATLAYQVANGMDADQILSLADGAIGDCWPDLTLILDVPPEVGLARNLSRTGTTDAIEQRSMHYRSQVRRLFLEMPARFRLPIRVLNASQSVDAVHGDVVAALMDRFGSSRSETQGERPASSRDSSGMPTNGCAAKARYGGRNGDRGLA